MRPAILGLLVAACVSLCHAAELREPIDRGTVARRLEDGRVYVSWRLLKSDPADIAFNVYRKSDDAQPVKLNVQPIRQTTGFIDPHSPKGAGCAWTVRPVIGDREVQEADPVIQRPATTDAAAQPYIAIRLDGQHTFQKVGIADLDGDRRYDFVLKQPNENIDPWYKYWKPSPDTYKLEAYGSDGRLLWRFDLGWAIERGIWYSPYVVYDLDGDGCAEVAVKTGQGDPRDKEGKVQTGPEHLTILDGRTGKPITSVDWPSREGFDGPHGYNYASRNQLCVAVLDGKTPSLVVERGTYNLIKLVAYQFRDGKLHEQWRWDNAPKDAKLTAGLKSLWGQGAHWMHAADVDGDGRDEVLIGSAVIDDNGKPLWSTGLGHPDHFYVGDLDPSRPGLEIYYGIEPRRDKNAMCLVDARTGEILWGHGERTQHIHSSGLASDIDPAHPGAECYSGERDLKDHRWLRNCKGQVLSTKDLGGLAPRAAYWDADPQRELLVRKKIVKYQGPELSPTVEGSVVAVADILGDWREEIITSAPGEMRIYVTTIPAADRRVCLMQDPLYRLDVVCAAMGYYQVPMLSYDAATAKP